MVKIYCCIICGALVKEVFSVHSNYAHLPLSLHLNQLIPGDFRK